jgi:hypothetical protein
MKRTLVLSFVMALVSAADARAQMTMGSFKGYLTGHLGVATSGDVSDGRSAIGLSVSVQEGNGWGAELDFGHSGDVRSGAQVLDLNTYLVNVAWIKPIGMIRPFGTAGVGILQLEGCTSPCNRPSRTYDLGLSAGGGVYAVLNDWVGVRGDARYFFASADHPDLGRPESFKFWRVSVGATFMWAILP